MKNLIVVGYGSMAQAILVQNTFINKHYNLFITGRDKQKANDFISTNELCAQKVVPSMRGERYVIDCEGRDILLCIKPRGIESFVFEGRARCVYSVLAGVSVETIQEHIESLYIVRAMPNIAARSKLSATAFYCYSTQPQHELYNTLQHDIYPFIESFGTAVQVQSENLIEASIATSGSGIAFLSLVAESLIDAGVLEGLSYTQSLELVRQSFIGFAEELTYKSPSELKYAISSPGGTTIRGIKALEQSGVRGAFIHAAHIATQYAKDFIAQSNQKAKKTRD